MSFNLDNGYHVFPEIISKKDLETFLKHFPINESGLINSNPSELLDAVQGQKFYDVSIRDSSRIKFENCPVLFDLLQKSVIDKIQSQVSNYEVIMRHDDLELVQYLPGQFFKAHTDHQNLTGNFFKSYTMLLCCHPCVKGGETIIYLNHLKVGKPLDQLTLGIDYVKIEETGHFPGSVMMFDKDLFHEGCSVIEGRKIIMVANLILIPNSNCAQSKTHFLKVNFRNNGSYLFKQEWFNTVPLKNSVYASIFKTAMGKNPLEMIYEYDEDLENLDGFKILYENVINVCNQCTENKIVKVEKIINNLRKINYPVSDKTDEFLTFLHGEGDHFECCLADYYQYLKLFDRRVHSDIIPIVYLKVSGDTDDVVLWFGIGNNQLLTLDLLPQKATWKHDYNTGKQILKSPGLSDMKPEDIRFLKNFHSILYNRNGLTKKQIAENREFVFQKLCGTNLSSIYLASGNDHFTQMKNYVVHMLTTINPPNYGDDKFVQRVNYAPDHLEGFPTNPTECDFDHICKSFSELSDYTPEEFNLLKNVIDIEAFQEYIQKLFKSHESNEIKYAAGRVCNEATYFNCNAKVISGFVRINPRFYSVDLSKKPNLFHYRYANKPHSSYDDDDDDGEDDDDF
jgi:hypothetical protein